MATKKNPTQKTPKGYGIPVPKRRAVLSDVRKIVATPMFRQLLLRAARS